MGRYIEQTEARSELQQRIVADLRAKAAEKVKQERGRAGEPGPAVDGVEDSAYMKGTKVTTTLAPVWALIAIATVGVFVYFVYLVNR